MEVPWGPHGNTKAQRSAMSHGTSVGLPEDRRGTIVLRWNILRPSTWLSWGFHETPMVLPWCFRRPTKYFHGPTLDLLWDSHGTPMGPWHFRGASIGRQCAAMALLYPDGSSIDLPWDYHGVSMGLPWDFRGTYVGL